MEVTKIGLLFSLQLLTCSLTSYGKDLDGNTTRIGNMQQNSQKSLFLAFLNAWNIEDVTASSTAAAVQVGLSTVKDRNLLPGYSTDYEIGNEQCNGRIGMQVTVDIWRRVEHLDGIIGGGCSVACQPVALLAAAWAIPSVSYGCASDALSNKNIYPTFSRTAGKYRSYIPSLVALVELFKWPRVGILCDVAELYQVAGKTLKKELEHRGISAFYQAIASAEINDNFIEENIKKQASAIKQLSQHTKVIFVLMYTQDVRNSLVIADELGLRDGEHVFCGLEIFPKTGKVQLYKPHLGLDIFEGWITASPADVDGSKWDGFTEKVLTVLDEQRFAPYRQVHPDITADQITIYPGLVHDAVLAWAYGVNKTLEQGYSPNDGFKVTENIFNSTFEGITGTVVIDEKGDRKPNYKVQMVQNGEMVTVLQWIAAESRLIKVYKPEDPEDWTGLLWPGNGTAPPSGIPPCGWNDEFCQEVETSGAPTTMVATVTVCIVVLVVAVVIAYVGRRARYEKELEGTKSCLIKAEDIAVILNNDLAGSALTFASAMTSNMQPVFIKRARYRNEMVAVKELGETSLTISDRKLLKELKSMREIQHDNVINFVGVCLDPGHVALLLEYAHRGSLQDALGENPLSLTWDFKLSLLIDIAQAMKYLHATIGPHGRLTSSNCLIDKRWTCKISEFGLNYLRENCRNFKQEHNLWTAPEILRMNQFSTADKRGDVFSFGIITQEVVTADEPYGCNVPLLEKQEIINKLKQGYPLYRPLVTAGRCSDGWLSLMSECWAEAPEERPTFRDISIRLQQLNGGKDLSLLDRMIMKLANHTTNLEDIVSERSAQLQDEKMKMEKLLLELLPLSVFNSLKVGQQVAPESFDDVTVFFSDMVGFTRISAAGTPMQVVQMLNLVYTIFDTVSAKFDVYKVATIGDAYFVASGVPIRNSNHAAEIGGMALGVLKAAFDCPIIHLKGETLQLRVGIHSGACVAGVVGTKMPRYLLFGDTVDIASRMESGGMSMRIHVSATTADRLRNVPGFGITERGTMEVTGYGAMTTYWLTELDK